MSLFYLNGQEKEGTIPHILSISLNGQEEKGRCPYSRPLPLGERAGVRGEAVRAETLKYFKESS